MATTLPPSGRWAGYYLYGYGGSRHRMKLTLSFAGNGAIDGGGVDDIAPFVIKGQVDVATNAARWTKAYVGMHTVEYSGLYCPRAICGDWTLMGHSGGFWMWPEAETEWEHAAEDVETEEPVLTETGRVAARRSGPRPLPRE
ncbi:MAG TPA: hypothetical protein VK686_11770 [Bryobacteraceae bacterium]|nr:hypothetical protein [Bryobacteraceae bacterium]